MFRLKKLCHKQADLIEQQRKDITKLNYWLGEYLDVLKNIESIDKSKSTILDVYTKSEKIYVMYATNIFKNTLFNTLYECDILTYNLNTSLINYDNWVTKSQIELKKCDSGLEIELVNIDTHVEGNQGHATKQIEKIISIAKLIKAKKIYGDFFMQTWIGLDNLKHFYTKNGFTVSKNGFHMNI